MSGFGYLAQLCGDLTRAATEQDVLQHGAVLTGEFDDVGRGFGVTERFGFDPQRVAGSGNSGANGGALIATDDDGLETTGQRTFFHHFSDDPDVRVATLDVRNQEKPATRRTGRYDCDARLVRFEGHRKYHARQNDAGLQGEKRQGDVLVSHCKTLSSD